MKTRNGQVIESRKTVTNIIVNGKHIAPSRQVLTYDQVKALGGVEFHGVGIDTVNPDRLATITYACGDDSGDLAPGQSLILEEGMIINIAHT